MIRYQLEILDIAIEKNTIVLLETGCGKTQIALLLMEHIAWTLKAEGKKCLVIFLAPAVALVKQQFEVIKEHTNLQVSYYIGGKGVKDWNKATLNEVLVMTPQILLNGLENSSLTLEMVNLMVLDECHHAWKDHPYAKIMKLYHTISQQKPKIFGMSASLIIKKGVSSNTDCEEQISQLEDVLDAKVYTMKDRHELDSFVHTAKQITKYYSPPSQQNDSFKLKLVSLCQFKDNKTRKISANVEYCLENLGLFCAYKAVQLYLAKEDRQKLCEEITGTVKMEQNVMDYLEDAHKLLEEELPSDVNELFKTPEGIEKAVKRGILTPKVQLLVHLLRQKSGGDPEKLCCIVFVQRVITAALISSLIQHLDCLDFLKTDFLSSVASTFGSRRQQKALEDFRQEKVQVLVTTDVIEEGIDVKSCSCVIRFDLPQTMRSFIQSRGRARQENSDFILFLERGNEKQKKRLFDIIKSMGSMMVTALNRNGTPIKEKSIVENDASKRLQEIGDVDEYLPEMTLNRNHMTCIKEKSVVEKDVSKRLHEAEDIDEHLQGMAVNRYSMPCIEDRSEVGKGVSNRLHEVGDDNEDLQGFIKEEDDFEEKVEVAEEDDEEKEGKISIKSGTTKIKELHETTKADALSESWGEEESGLNLQVYKLVFTSHCNDENSYANFALLIKVVLDNGITNTEIDLFLTTEKIVKAKLLPSGEITLDLNQLRDAKAFQEIIFNGVFGNLRKREKINEMKNIWCSSNMYFLLPLESEKSGAIGIDWKCIETCAAQARTFKFLSTISGKDHNLKDNLEEVPMVGTTLLYSKAKSEIICLASEICEASNLIDKAVVAVHNGIIYCVVKVIHDKTAKSPFLLSKDSKAKHYDSYCDYFQRKYGNKLKHLSQPLLGVKKAQGPHNLLAKHLQKPNVDDSNFVELPPELCLDLGVPSSVIRSLYLVPSAMHRLSSLMLASQLHKEVRKECPNCPLVPAAVIMEALTSRKCLECFSYERLELLGDSFLKYAISRNLFLKYEKEDEGQLSVRRAEAICNPTLHRLALDRNLQGYIKDEPFDVRKWVAPGLLCRSIVPCCCNPRNPDSLQMGKACDKGHRWMYSKTISDVVEALIGAHLVGGGSTAALEFMKWMNMEIEVEDKWVEDAFNRTFAYPNALSTDLEELQLLLNYHFQNQALLVEAITHASIEEEHGGCSYQRLEFLGDSVLDYLITWHLYSTYQGLSPGALTDLRQAAVNNENFSQVTVKHNIQKYLRHHSDELRNQIAKFIKDFEQSKGGECRFISFGGGVHAPKVLGDLLESIAGAILVDTRLKLNVVWDRIKPVLSPIVTPENLELQPLRELHQLCEQNGYKYIWKHITKQGEVQVATVEIQLKESTISGKGSDMNKKTAKTKAAKDALSQLEVKGIYYGCRGYVQVPVDLTGNAIPDTTSNFIAQEKMINANSPCIVSREVEMAVSLDQCQGGEMDQEENLLCPRKMITHKNDLNPLPHLESTKEKDNRLSTKKHKLEEIIYSKRKSSVCRTDMHAHEPLGKKPRLLETSVNFLISEDHSVDGKDEAITHISKDNSNKNCTLGGGLKSLSNENAASKCATKTKKAHSKSVCIFINSQRGCHRRNLHELCQKMHCREPRYDLIEEVGMPHERRFLFKVVVDVLNKECLSIQGEQERDHARAKDSAAFKMLIELEKRGLCSIKCWNNDCGKIQHEYE